MGNLSKDLVGFKNRGVRNVDFTNESVIFMVSLLRSLGAEPLIFLPYCRPAGTFFSSVGTTVW
jgi:hypothetical protein